MDGRAGPPGWGDGHVSGRSCERADPAGPRPVGLRVATYNVRGLRAGAGAVAEAVRGLRADVLLLQESGGRLALWRLARRLGMAVASDPPSPFRRRVKNAVLARPPWRLEASRLFRFPEGDPWYPRGALVARLAGPVALTAASVHLGLRPAERLRHARALAELSASLPGPLVLGGDLNEVPGGRAVGVLRSRLRDAWAEAGSGPGATYPASAPGARIDYLLVGAGVRVRGVEVAAAPASDHLPLVATLELPAAGGQPEAGEEQERAPGARPRSARRAPQRPGFRKSWATR